MNSNTNPINQAELKFRDIYHLINGHYPTFNTITGSKISFWGRAHGSQNGNYGEKAYLPISEAITGTAIDFDKVAVATSMNVDNKVYDELISFTTAEERAKISREFNKETLSLMCTNGKISDLFDNPLKYTADDITDNYYIVIMGCIHNHITVEVISNIMKTNPVKSKIIGSFESTNAKHPREIVQYTYNMYGKQIHLITGFNVFGGKNGHDHKNMKINGKNINIYK